MQISASESIDRDTGQTMTEYALILSAIAIAVFAAYKLLGSNINTLTTRVNTQLSAT